MGWIGRHYADATGRKLGNHWSLKGRLSLGGFTTQEPTEVIIDNNAGNSGAQINLLVRRVRNPMMGSNSVSETVNYHHSSTHSRCAISKLSIIGVSRVKSSHRSPSWHMKPSTEGSYLEMCHTLSPVRATDQQITSTAALPTRQYP